MLSFLFQDSLCKEKEAQNLRGRTKNNFFITHSPSAFLLFLIHAVNLRIQNNAFNQFASNESHCFKYRNASSL